MKLDRRAVLAGAAAVALPRVAIGQGVPELQTMRSTARSWLWLAEDYGTAGGFFAKAGVKVISNASNRGVNIQALAGGGVDIVLGDPGELMNARAQDFGVRGFAQSVGKYASHVVVKQSVLDAAKIAETSPVAAKIAVLKGLNLGTTGPGAAPDNLFRWLGVHGGMDPNKDFRLVPIQGGGPGMVAGLQQNVIDGFCLSSPSADIAVSKAGCGYLFDMALNPPPEFASYCYIIASASEQSLKNKREPLLRYVTGLTLALRAIAADPAAFKAFAVPFLELDPAIAERAFASNSKIYFESPVPDGALYQKNLDMSNLVNRTQGLDPMPAKLTFDYVFDRDLAAEAVKKL